MCLMASKMRRDSDNKQLFSSLSVCFFCYQIEIFLLYFVDAILMPESRALRGNEDAVVPRRSDVALTAAPL